MEWIAIILFGGIIFREFSIVNQLVIKTQKKIIETILLIIGIGVLFYITYAYASTPKHYLLGILGGILYIISYLKEGVTSKGFVSLYRSLQFIPWDKVEEVHINKGENIKISYSGNGNSNKLYFKNEDYDRIMEILSDNILNSLIIIDNELRN